MARVLDLVDLAREQQRRDPYAEMLAVVAQMQTAIADVVTRNFRGEIADEVGRRFDEFNAKFDAFRSECQAMACEAAAREVALLPVPERVIERIIERVEAEDEAEDEAEELRAVTPVRRDGVIVEIKVGEDTYDVVRNRDGLIKSVKPRVA